MPLFPGHRYLGPGNPTDNGEPVDKDDAIARTHDEQYDKATEPGHIRDSDLQAIGAFSSDFISTGNWHSAVGALGLATKYSVESVTGVLYPSSSELRKRKRENETTPVKMAEQPPAKQARMDQNTPSSSGGDAILQKQREGGGGQGTSASGQANEHTGVNMTASGSFKKGTLTFRHHRMMFTYGYQFKSFKSKYVTGDSDAISLTTTPYANVPVDCLPWYITPAEFENLPLMSSVKSCTTVITPMGYRTPFITNSAGINSVNSNLLVFGVYAHGLNNRFNGGNGKITSTGDNPMYPTTYNIDATEGLDIEGWWGKRTQNEVSVSFDNIPASFGNMKPFHTYYSQNLDMREGGSSLPELNQALNYFPMINGTGNVPIVWTYKPQINILKPAYAYAPIRDNNGTNTTSFLMGNKIQGSAVWDINITAMGQTSKIVNKTVHNSTVPAVPYDSYIEHAGITSHGFVEYAGGMRPPSLHVGVLPVHAYSTNITDSTVQEIIAIFKCETEITIEYSFDLTHGYDSYVPPNLSTYALNKYLKIGSLPHWLHGYRSVINYSTLGST